MTINSKDIFDQVLQLPEDEQRALQTLLNQKHPASHWGQRVIAAINALSPEMKNDPAYDDPVAWVKQQRDIHDSRRNSSGDSD